MTDTELPSTSLGPIPEVSRIGLGLAALGRPAYLNLRHGDDLDGRRSPESLETHLHAMVDLAVGSGITYLDAARSYGRSEEFLASWPGLSRHSDVVIGSKWGYTYVGDWRIDVPVHEVKDHSLAAFQRQVIETDELLGDRLALYQIHSATPETGVLEDRSVLGALGDLRDRGVVVGLTTSGPTQADTLLRAVDTEVGGERLFGVCEVTWNLFETSVGPAAQVAHDAGMGVIVKEAVANGRLTERGDATVILGQSDASPDAIALAAVLAQPWCDVVLSGATTAEQLRSNLNALLVDPETIEQLPKMAEDPDAYWDQRSEITWT